jgi:hypothetical protein
VWAGTVRAKNAPRLVAAARELRDRWLEQVNADPSSLLAQGKYDVRRGLEGKTIAMTGTLIDDNIRPALPAPVAA